MISDETFPFEAMIEMDDENDQLYSIAANGDTLASTETFESSANSSDFSNFPPTSAESGRRRSAFEFTESSFGSMVSSKKLTLAPPLKVPVRQKKSFSCQDLQQKKQNYEHVQSKVKKLIESMSVEERRRKILSRHKSMPISTQPPTEETTYSDDPIILIRELRKKSVQIYELQEKNEEKDSRIYALEYERSKMRLTFDKLRVEMFELKEKERDYKQMLAVSPTLKMLKNSSVQTEDLKVYNDHNVSHIRELTFNNDTTPFLNQTHFSELNNASSDNLIPEVILEEMSNVTRTVHSPSEADDNQIEEEQKKKKKFQRFFKLMSCVSK